MLGWKEYELEVVRDMNDNVIIICSIENFDTDGRAYRAIRLRWHQRRRLTDREYEVMRDASIKVIREIGS